MKQVLNSKNSSEVGIDEAKDDVDPQEVENKINTITKRTNYFTKFVLIVMTLISSGILLNRGSVCVSK